MRIQDKCFNFIALTVTPNVVCMTVTGTAVCPTVSSCHMVARRGLTQGILGASVVHCIVPLWQV